ncbi:MAG: hypothetical protein IKB67_03410 [Clostridia bacterium]|nr:hypothetical protein [Clostridia bacterium]
MSKKLYERPILNCHELLLNGVDVLTTSTQNGESYSGEGYDLENGRWW